MSTQPRVVLERRPQPCLPLVVRDLHLPDVVIGTADAGPPVDRRHHRHRPRAVAEHAAEDHAGLAEAFRMEEPPGEVGQHEGEQAEQDEAGRAWMPGETGAQATLGGEIDPVQPAQITKVQLAPCHRPPSSIVPISEP